MKDLHIHTKYSDGELDEFQIVKAVKESGIKEFSVCDHDTIEGTVKVHRLLKNDKELIHHLGVELSCHIYEMYGGIDVHLLVRDFGENDEIVNFLVDKIAYLRKQKIQRMVDLVHKVYDIKISQEEIEEKEKLTNSFGKPHIYAILSNHGDFDRETFYKNMRSLKADDLKLNAIEVVKLLKDRKGYVTLAHPIEIMDEYNLTYEDIDKIVGVLTSNGLKGLETRHSKQTKEDSAIFSSIAKKYSLIETMGSDYHGPIVKPNVKLGVCVKE